MYSFSAHLRKHPSDEVPDDKATHVIPTTGVAGELVSEKTQTPVSGGSIRRNIKATVLTFRVIVDRPNMARVQLLLCNISDRALYFKLKSNVGSNVSVRPFSSSIISVLRGIYDTCDGEIPPHAQVRLVLTWTRPSNYQHWRDVPSPKLLITTRFMDAKSDSDASTTSIRLIARVSTTKTCHASNPPVEQLLLDAVGKTENMEVSSYVAFYFHIFWMEINVLEEVGKIGNDRSGVTNAIQLRKKCLGTLALIYTYQNYFLNFWIEFVSIH
uniref:DUF667 domain-containing protein n=1 Tax=Angiostrongylus cantonensis TaxID=6313 RepID=A0A0K0DHX1_ANGCA